MKEIQINMLNVILLKKYIFDPNDVDPLHKEQVDEMTKNAILEYKKLQKNGWVNICDENSSDDLLDDSNLSKNVENGENGESNKNSKNDKNNKNSENDCLESDINYDKFVLTDSKDKKTQITFLEN